MDELEARVVPELGGNDGQCEVLADVVADGGSHDRRQTQDGIGDLGVEFRLGADERLHVPQLSLVPRRAAARERLAFIGNRRPAGAGGVDRRLGLDHDPAHIGTAGDGAEQGLCPQHDALAGSLRSHRRGAIERSEVENRGR